MMIVGEIKNIFSHYEYNPASTTPIATFRSLIWSGCEWLILDSLEGNKLAVELSERVKSAI